MDEQSSHIEDKQRIICQHDLWCALVGDARRLLVPPLVAALRLWDLISSTLENDDVLDAGAGLECRVDDGLGGYSLPTASTVRTTQLLQSMMRSRRASAEKPEIGRH